MPIKPENLAPNGQNRHLSKAAREARMRRGDPISCAHCGTPFAPYLRCDVRFCSQKCRKAARPSAPKAPKTCKRCGVLFTPLLSMKAAYCSIACRTKNKHEAVKTDVAKREKKREYQRAYSKSPRYRHGQKNHKARRRSAEQDGTVTAEQWASIVDRFRNCCAYCKRSNWKLTMDHVVPLSKGGKHDPSNVVPACQPCNSAKCDNDWSGRLQCQ